MTALTPAQVRDHARALILEYGEGWDDELIVERLGRDPEPLTDDECDTAAVAIAGAIRTARITVDWDDAHTYLSTACLHARLDNRDELHGYCASAEGRHGAKAGAVCKFGSEPCVCPCHTEETP